MSDSLVPFATIVIVARSTTYVVILIPNVFFAVNSAPSASRTTVKGMRRAFAQALTLVGVTAVVGVDPSTSTSTNIALPTSAAYFEDTSRVADLQRPHQYADVHTSAYRCEPPFRISESLTGPRVASVASPVVAPSRTKPSRSRSHNR
jgi:hypothetical protein